MLDSLRNIESAQFTRTNLCNQQISGRPILFARFQFHRGWFHGADGFSGHRFSESNQMWFLQIRSIWIHSASWCTLRNGLKYYSWENLCDTLVLVLVTVCRNCQQHALEIRNADIVFNVRKRQHTFTLIIHWQFIQSISLFHIFFYF